MIGSNKTDTVDQLASAPMDRGRLSGNIWVDFLGHISSYDEEMKKQFQAKNKLTMSMDISSVEIVRLARMVYCGKYRPHRTGMVSATTIR